MSAFDEMNEGYARYGTAGKSLHYVCWRQTMSPPRAYSGYAFLDWHPVDELPRLPLDVRFESFSIRLEEAIKLHEGRAA